MLRAHNVISKIEGTVGIAVGAASDAVFTRPSNPWRSRGACAWPLASTERTQPQLMFRQVVVDDSVAVCALPTT
jgi:hypothetical protein